MDSKRRILPSGWYPAEPALNCLQAIYKQVGQNNPNTAREWGKNNGRKMFEEVYKHIQISISDSDPDTEPVYYFVQGWIEVLVEMTGGKSPRIEFLRKHWKGDPETVLAATWS